MSPGTEFFHGEGLALFLDVDGTLLEIAPTPNGVRVPAALRNTLELARARQHGALALLSGRSLAEIDELFAPHVFAASGKHGLEVRLPSGEIVRPDIDTSALARARQRLTELERQHRGLLMEDKSVAIAMHFRLAPRARSEVEAVMRELHAELRGEFVLRPGKYLFELMPAGFNERSAIELFMGQHEFAGRIPVFVGDDPTDEVGFEAVNEMGGHSIRVGDLEQTAARHRFASVRTVVAWLRHRNLRPPRPVLARDRGEDQ